MEKLRFSRRQWLGLAVGGTAFVACSALSSSLMAQEDKFVLQCPSSTPSISAPSYPGASKIILSNNLARPTGKAEDAPGQLVYLTGRIVDQDCTPVTNAIVDLWQPNPVGQYRWASRDELLTPYPIFAGNGRAVTDNMGRYRFTTLFPGGYGRNAPQIHLRVSHPEFPTLTTSLYMRGDRRNGADPRFQAINPGSRNKLLADVNTRMENPALDVIFDVTLHGRSTYRDY